MEKKFFLSYPKCSPVSQTGQPKCQRPQNVDGGLGVNGLYLFV